MLHYAVYVRSTTCDSTVKAHKLKQVSAELQITRLHAAVETHQQANWQSWFNTAQQTLDKLSLQSTAQPDQQQSSVIG